MRDASECTVQDVLHDKHPPPTPVNTPALVTTSAEPLEVYPVHVDPLTGDVIRTAALHMEGSAGPSGVDAAGH